MSLLYPTRHKCIVAWLIIFLAFTNTFIFSAENNHLYVTRDKFEADKCASLWLIKRFVDPQATFIIRNASTPLGEGIKFDVPEAKLRRYHNRSTFEYILYVYDIEDQTLDYIGKLIHDIEINTWQEKAWPQTLVVQEKLTDIIQNSTGTEDIIEKSTIYFDSLYNDLKKVH